MRIAIMMIIGVMSAHLCAMNGGSLPILDPVRTHLFKLPHQVTLENVSGSPSQASAILAEKRLYEQRTQPKYLFKLYSMLVNPQDSTVVFLDRVSHVAVFAAAGIAAGAGLSYVIPGTDVVAPVLGGIAAGTLTALHVVRKAIEEKDAHTSLAKLLSEKPE